jgi:DNA-binding IclR family transcriptional regulator
MTVEAAVPGARTIERALTVLDSFTPTQRQWRTSRLAEHCGLPVPTTHRILRVLESYGYVARDPGSRAYTLGPRAAGLVREEPLLADLRAIAWPTLRALRNATGARACACALSEAQDRQVEAAALGDAADESVGDLGTPLHAGASARILLAQLPNREVGAVLEGELEQVGPATITDPARLWQEVRAIRRRGWALSREEAAAGCWALAAPVPAPGRGSCALAIGGALEDFDRDRARRQVAALILAARALAVRLRDEGRETAATHRRKARTAAVARRRFQDIERGDARWQTA